MIHVLAIFAVKEGELLLAMARIIGGITVQEDFFGSFSPSVAMLQKPLKTNGPEPFDGCLIGMILQTRERGLRGQGVGFTHDGLKSRIRAQRVGIVAVLVTCSDLINPLTQHLMSMVLDEHRIAPLLTQSTKSLCERQLRVKLAQEQKTAVARDLTAVKIQDDFWLKTEGKLIMTPCSHRSSVCCERLVW